MSKISTVYDTLLTVLSAIFPEKTRLFYPYSLTDNPEHVLRDGYGLIKTSTEPVPSELCRFNDAHGFDVVLTREVVRAESQLTPVDEKVKALLEDAFELRERVYRYDELGIATDITNVSLGSVSAVEEFLTGKSKFISVVVSFVVNVTEDLQ